MVINVGPLISRLPFVSENLKRVGEISGKESCQGKVFIANFTSGDTPVIVPCMRVNYTVKYEVNNGNLGGSAAKIRGNVRKLSDK